MFYFVKSTKGVTWLIAKRSYVARWARKYTKSSLKMKKKILN